MAAKEVAWQGLQAPQGCHQEPLFLVLEEHVHGDVLGRGVVECQNL
ncbi:Hypothetical protein AA314_00465 [Archangium gephyra]|uniref:Uncharacterized protein n=1 Tax=Archangium gephyra TaxID=48 RepID=A0AAC8Q1Z9_9BACT|nr:Hypothetical protein AA314_00465 [Archangium gephyra]